MPTEPPCPRGEHARAVSTKPSTKPPPLRPRPHAYRRTHLPRHIERASRAITPHTHPPRRAISPPSPRALRRDLPPTRCAQSHRARHPRLPTSPSARVPRGHARRASRINFPRTSHRAVARARTAHAAPTTPRARARDTTPAVRDGARIASSTSSSAVPRRGRRHHDDDAS